MASFQSEDKGGMFFPIDNPVPPGSPKRTDSPSGSPGRNPKMKGEYRLKLNESVGAFRPCRRSRADSLVHHPYPKSPSGSCSPTLRSMGSPEGSVVFDLLADQNREPVGGQPISPQLRSMSPLSVPMREQSAEEEEFLQGRLPTIMPVQTYVAAFAELPQGARTTLRTCITAWREGRMPRDQVRDFVRSVAWQSPALNEWANEAAPSPTAAAGVQLLSLEDLAALMGSAMSPSWDGPLAEAAGAGEGGREVSPAGSAASSHGEPCGPDCGPARAREGGGGGGGVRATEEEVKEALAVVQDASVMDSTRTERLAEVLERHPGLQFLFLGNGWDPVAKGFRGRPDWGLAEQCLVGQAPSRGPSGSGGGGGSRGGGVGSGA